MRSKYEIRSEVIQLNSQAYNIRSTRPEESLELAKKALHLSVEHDIQSAILEARLNIGFYHMYKGTHRLAAEMFTEVLYKAEDQQEEVIKHKAYYNLGVLHFRISDYEDSIQYLEKSRSFFELTGNKKMLSKCQFQFASVRFALQDYADALELCMSALDWERTQGTDNSLAALLTLLGRIYLKTGNREQAIAAFDESYELRELSGDFIGFASCVYYQIEFYLEVEDFDKVQELIHDHEELFERIEFPMGRGLFAQISGRYYARVDAIDAAIEKHKLAIKIADSFDLKSLCEESYQDISQLYEQKGDLQNALQYHKWYLVAKEAALKHKSRIQLDNIKLHREVNDIKQEARLERLKREELAEANETISRIHLELKSSVTYAKRIQDAILPHHESLKAAFNDYVFINEPKEIVSGDFLWMHREGAITYLAVADCTGHGVPGAILSVYATNALNKAVQGGKLTDPAKILDHVREQFIQDFMSEKVTLKDGMDIALIKIEGNKIILSAAYRSLWVKRAGAILEWKGDRQPVGLYLNMIPFSNQEIQLESGDQVYLFTDGFTDQIGGPKTKKLKNRLLKSWLVETSQKAGMEQKVDLMYRMDNWQGAQEQTDDRMLFSFTYHD